MRCVTQPAMFHSCLAPTQPLPTTAKRYPTLMETILAIALQHLPNARVRVAILVSCSHPTTQVHGNLYGTSFQSVTSVLETGRVCILDIDVQGARSVRKSGLQAIFVFIAPPSLEDLANRLAARGTETVEQITRRLNNAKQEIER